MRFEVLGLRLVRLHRLLGVWVFRAWGVSGLVTFFYLNYVFFV